MRSGQINESRKILSPYRGLNCSPPGTKSQCATIESYADPLTFLNLVPLKGEPINYKKIYITFGERIIIRTEHNLVMGNSNLK